MFDGMMKALKMTCKDVYPLISESQDRPLPFYNKIRLKMHLAICGLCEIYNRQLDIIRKVAQSLGNDETKAREGTNMKPEVKEKIKKWIAEKS
jgi:chromosome condensin MukBEF ATPase and DNA-binding subunit MukB